MRYEQELLERARMEAMDKPLPTLAERQADAAELLPVALAELKVKAQLGDVTAAKALLDYSDRLLSLASGEDEAWLAESPSEATDTM